MDRRNAIPFVLLLLPLSMGGQALAQNSPAELSTAASASQTSPSAVQTAATPPEPAAKRVWTNDDLSDLSAGSEVLNHAGPAVKPPATTAKPSAPKSKDTKSYNDQIAKLQAQLPPLDSQISQLQEALAGKPVDTTRTWGGVRPDDWSLQLARLQQKRDDVVGKIAALKDQARHGGI